MVTDKRVIISPSILSADFTHLKDEIDSVATADMLHIDVMDGVFVPVITFGSHITAQIKGITDLPLDVHLMVSHPENQIKEFINAGADYITFHYEASPHSHRLIQMIKDAGLKAGISINPGTPVSVLSDIIGFVDVVLIMSVNPGWGGQRFIPQSINKISSVRDMIERSGSGAQIMVDGGINDTVAPEVVKAGADMLVSGSYIFGSKDRASAINSLR